MARLLARDGDFDLVVVRRPFSSVWSVTGTSPLPGERMTLYVTSGVVDHGYWRDLLVGDIAFDRRHFVYSDNPALLPVAVGPETRAAIAAAGSRLALHVHRGRVHTEERTDTPGAELTQRHRAVHAAFAADHARAVERWQRFSDAFEGRVLAKWPPVLALLRPIGTIVVSLTWSMPGDADAADWVSAGDSLATELLAERGTPGPPWRLDPGISTIGKHERIGDRWFDVHGDIPLSRDELAHAFPRARVVSLRVDQRITLRLAGMVFERARLEAAIALLGRVSAPEAADSPYR